MTILVEEGVQTPRICHLPVFESTETGREALEVAALAGLTLDPWEAYVLEMSLAKTADHRLAATEVGLCVPRQNGKDAVIEARELAGLFHLNERLIIHSAQLFATSKEHFMRLLMLIESVPDFSKRVRTVSRSHGEEGITLHGGQRIRFLTRSKGGGRGFSAPLVIFNEAMFLPEAALGALLPTQAAMPNRQRWYAGSAVDQLVHENGVVFARIRERGIRQQDPRLAYFEWSVDAEGPDMLTDSDFDDVGLWAQSNPGFGIRIMREAVEDELRTLDRRTFAVERLGVGDWPATDGTHDTVIPLEAWDRLTDEESLVEDPVCLAFDVTPDRAFASIVAAGRRQDGLPHVEVIDHRRGTGWVVPRLAELRDAHEPLAIMADATGPAASLIHQAEEFQFDVDAVSASDHAKACGQLLDLVLEQRLRHLGSAELASAIKGATRRPLGDAWAWSRKNSGTDISPLVAATLALWGAETMLAGGDATPTVW